MKYCLFLLFLPCLAPAQSSGEERAAVRAVIESMFDGMRAGDSSMVRAAFFPGAQLHTTIIDRAGNPALAGSPLQSFLEAVAAPRHEIWDEKIWSYDIQIEQNLASAWTEYSFFRGPRLSHCGVNAFQLFKSAEGWKIIQVTDTRRVEGCHAQPPEPEKTLHGLIDAWHAAAARADAEAFFGAMTPEGIYIGSDASERWRRDELREWAKKAFERDSAWDFKPQNRHITLAENGRIAWWDELLDTWMGVCRGSGVLSFTKNGWKITHYTLSVTVPNEKIRAFLELVRQN
jgi:hypothetical protein